MNAPTDFLLFVYANNKKTIQNGWSLNNNNYTIKKLPKRKKQPSWLFFGAGDRTWTGTVAMTEGF